ELQVESAAVDVQRLPQEAHAHRRALDVPARPSRSPRAVPLRLARLGAFPQGEVARVALLVADLDAGPGFQLLRVAIAELAIVRVAGDVEVDIAVGRVGKPPVNQSLDHGDDVADVLRGPRHVVDAGDVEPLEIADIVLRHPVGQLFHGRVLLAGLDDQLVVDISDIDNESHRVTEV